MFVLQPFDRPRRSGQGRVLVVMLFLLACSILAVATQAQVIADPGFENGGAGWSNCSVEVLPSSVLNGGDAQHVAVVDAGHVLAQRISGFTPNAEYRLRFTAARWMPGPVPALASAAVYLDSSLFTMISCTGDLDLQQQELRFTAHQATIDLRIAASFSGAGGLVFDDFALSTVNLLTIQIADYQAWQDNDAVEVAWTTATERDNAYFEVERSTDLQAWTFIGRVAAMGQSQTPLPYRLTDAAPVEGAAYYHLKQVGTDGNVAVSPALPVFFKGEERTVLWPNPATDQVRLLAGGGSRRRVRVLDASGRVMEVSDQLDGEAYVFGISALPSGQYMVQDADSAASLGRFVKQ